MKSSTHTSQHAVGLVNNRTPSDVLHFGCGSGLPLVSGVEGCDCSLAVVLIVVSDTWSRRCGCVGAFAAMAALARLATVSVVVLKYGGDSRQPIGSTFGSAIRASSPGLLGKSMAGFGTSSAFIQIL